MVLVVLASVLIPAAFFGWIIRRWYENVPSVAVLVAVAVAVAFVASGLPPKYDPFPLDEVVRGYPYRSAFGDVVARNPLTNDVVKQILPWMQIAREQLLRGNAPLWNRYQFSGYPLLGNGQSAPFAPLFLITLFVPLPKQLVAMAALKIFIALLFGFALLRRLNVSTAAAIGGAAVFAISVFQTVYLYYPLTSVTCLLPALAFAIHGAINDGRLRWLILTAAVTGAAVSSGHPESVFHACVAAVILILAFWPTEMRALQRLSKIWRTVAAAVLGSLVAAPAWLPVVQQAALSGRAANIASGAGVNGPFDHLAAYSLLNPNVFGNPAHGNWNWNYNYSMVAPSYAGLVAAALFIAAIFLPFRRSRWEVLLAIAAVLLFLIAMDWTPVGRLVNSVVPFRFVANDRLRFVEMFFVSLIVARQVDRVAAGERGAAVGCAVVILAAELFLLAKKWQHPLGIESVGGAIVVCLFAVALVALPMTARRTIFPGIASVLIIAELFVFNWGFNRAVPSAYYRPELPILDKLRAVTHEKPGRVVGFDWTFLPNAAAQYGVEDIRGSDPMLFAAYRKFLSSICVPESLHDVPRVQNVDQPGLDFLNVRYLIADPTFAASDRWQLIYEGRDGRLFESSTALPRFFAPHAIIKGGGSDTPPLESLDLRSTVLVEGTSACCANPDAIVESRSNASGTDLTVRVAANAPTFIASSQVLAPGWRLRVNGKTSPLVRINGAFMGFEVPRGTSVARLKYQPLTYRVGWVISLASIAVGVFYCRKQRPRTAAPVHATDTSPCNT